MNVSKASLWLTNILIGAAICCADLIWLFTHSNNSDLKQGIELKTDKDLTI